MKNPAKVVAVLSHRGGSMKTTLSALLGMALSREGTSTVVVDLSPGGGCASLESNLLTESTVRQLGSGPEGLGRRDHASWPLTVLRDSSYIRYDTAGRLRALEAHGFGADALLLDMPTVSEELLQDLLTPVDLVLVTLPSDSVAVRSMQKFLEALRSIRSRPGRRFSVVVMPTGTGRRTPENIAIDRFVNDTFGPLLAGATLPWDDDLAQTVANAQFPDWQRVSPTVRSNIVLLAKGLRERLALPAGKVLPV